MVAGGRGWVETARTYIAVSGRKAYAEEDIFGFDIKMEDLLGMNVLYAAADIHPYLVCCIFGQFRHPPSVHELRKVLSTVFCEDPPRL